MRANNVVLNDKLEDVSISKAYSFHSHLKLVSLKLENYLRDMLNFIGMMKYKYLLSLKDLWNL